MSILLDALAAHNTGLLITVDEVTPHLDEMIRLASVYQLFIREGRKISLLMAGLPSQVSSLLNDPAVTFLRRASQYDLPRIDDYEIEAAFQKTIEDSGRTIEKKALNEAVSAIGGFPYMMQLVGFRAWESAGNAKRITTRAVSEGIHMAALDLERRVIKTTVQELSSGDIAFLGAMLPDKDISMVSAIEQRMKKNSGYVSRYRARLLESGVIETAGRGKLRFALPGLKEYLLRETDQMIPAGNGKL